ncbi:MAG: hypothetical protein ACI865_002017 [Flavobacteriaceae bacterium]|jgi:hypothetical protein
MFLLGLSLSGVNAQESIVPSGGNAESINGSVSYSVGQVFYTTTSGIDGSTEQGVQHAIEIYTAGSDEFDEITLECRVYPNPTADFLTLDVKNFSKSGLSYTMYDMNGRILNQQKIVESSMIIEMIDFAPATYFLKISDDNEVVRTFKIIKK